MVGLAKKPAAASDPALTVVWRRVETLRPDPANPRFHSPNQIGQLARSIAAFGFNVPILVDRGLRIIAGHGRLLAAREPGLREVPTILLDHLNEAQIRFRDRDNRFRTRRDRVRDGLLSCSAAPGPASPGPRQPHAAAVAIGLPRR